MAEVQITNKLLKEAIADAETLVATAVENAKLSLEETFTPQIKSMIERKLRAEAEEVPHEDGEPEGSSEMPADSSDIGGGENKEPSDDAFASAEDDMSGEGHTDSSTDWYDDWSDSDFDLNEIIKELEEDVDMMNDKKEDDEDEEKESEEDSDEDSEEKDEESEEDSDEEEGEYPEGEPEGDEDSDDDIPAKSSGAGEEDAAKFTLDEFVSMMEEAGYDISDVFAPAYAVDEPSAPPMEEGRNKTINKEKKKQAQLSQFSDDEREDARAMAFINRLDPSAAQSPHSPDGVLTQWARRPQGTPAPQRMEETDLNLEEILAMLEAEDASIQEADASEEMTSQLQELQKELAESRQAIHILRGKLNEVNLLNAKLLFTNKIFRKPGMSDEQKIMVVENFDRATTVREVKMVYAVLAESLKPTASTKAVKSQRKVMAEGLASKATPSTAPKQEIIAENTVAKRLQQLAGIIS